MSNHTENLKNHFSANQPFRRYSRRKFDLQRSRWNLHLSINFNFFAKRYPPVKFIAKRYPLSNRSENLKKSFFCKPTIQALLETQIRFATVLCNLQLSINFNFFAKRYPPVKFLLPCQIVRKTLKNLFSANLPFRRYSRRNSIKNKNKFHLINYFGVC